MTFHRPPRWPATLALFLAGLSVPGSALADYLIQRGDVLEISVAGLPDLRQRSVIGPDGEVTFPLAAPIKVAGIDLAAALKRVKAELSQKLYQQRAPDGREYTIAITPDSVSLAVAEYRPVYVDGDVTKPGSQTYRPGMTVRQAVALAGGYEIMRFRMDNPFLQSADLRGEHSSLWIQHAKQLAKVSRLQAELGMKTVEPIGDMTEAPLPFEELARVRDLAVQELDAQRKQYDAERAHFESAVKLANEQISILAARKQKEEENLEEDNANFRKLKEFSSRGNLPMTRISEARRLSLFSATQVLQTTVQLSEALQRRDEAQRKLVRLTEQRQIQSIRELGEASASVARIRSRLQAVSTKIAYTGIVRSQLARGGAKPFIRVIREGGPNNGEEVSESTELHPGDTVEVALRTEFTGDASKM